MILAAKSLALNPKDPPTWQALANHSKSVSDSIKKLVSSIRDKAPGQTECDDVISKLSNCVRQLDQASLSAISQNLSPKREKSAQAFAEQTTNCAMEIADRIDSVRSAAKGEAEKLGHAVTQIAHYFEPMVLAATGSASYLLNSKQQMMMLDQSKTVTECAIQLVLVAKEAGGNPKVNFIGLLLLFINGNIDNIFFFFFFPRIGHSSPHGLGRICRGNERGSPRFAVDSRDGGYRGWCSVWPSRFDYCLDELDGKQGSNGNGIVYSNRSLNVCNHSIHA